MSAGRAVASSASTGLVESVTGNAGAALAAVQTSLIGSIKVGAKTAAADRYNQELAATLLGQLFPELADDERAQAVARIALPTLLVGLCTLFPEQFGKFAGPVTAAAQLANDAAFRDIIEPFLPSVVDTLSGFSNVAPALATVGQ
jgi:hypothetical protein